MEEKKGNFRHIIRVVGTDLSGNGKLINELRKIRGISFVFANMLCKVAKADKNQEMGYVEDSTIARIEDAIKNPDKFNVPKWLYNRRADPEDGVSRHLVGADLKFTHENDIRLMKKIKSYKGIRHSFGLPVRGQRTKSNFRKNKGKVTGVSKSRQAKAAASAKPAAEKKEKK
jgi:small subunit ribosomal protein S13